MAYQIQYGKPSNREVAAQKQDSKNTAPIRWAFFSIVLIAITILARTGGLDFLIPGEKEVTKHAFYSMVDDLKRGDGMKHAVSTFCEEILAGAESKN